MHTQRHLLILWVLLMLASCSPKVSKTITKSYAPLDFQEEVLVLDRGTPIPDGAEIMGTIKIGDSGFTVECDYRTVIETAKIEARKVGGNAIKVTEHKPPSGGSSCHRIKVAVLLIENTEELWAAIKKADEAADWDYALLHFFRFSGAGQLVGYDIHLGNVVICRARNNWKTTVEIRIFGRNTLWASTEAKTEIPINIEPGREYYIRCGLGYGIMVGRPTLQLVDKNTGKAEFASIKSRK
jgi:hypothetical protein